MSNLANYLTLSRFLTAPLFLYLITRLDNSNSGSISIIAAVVVIVTLLTDMFDGYAARAQNNVTNFGKIMDPVADSTFFLTALFAFSASDRFDVPIWLPIIVLYREIGMHVLRRYAALSGVVLAAKVSGKTKMVIQSVLLVAIMLLISIADNNWYEVAVQTLNNIVFWSIAIIAFVNVVSMIEYLGEIPKMRKED
ncbi:MAG: CDP-diacylglycerol--glycerol-3-phosphate 3-phosphatidyltransferase [Planctomycetota bacterium]|jgi:CDP-diacylglycerol--glycerol-3-phosphate 3-phosphatidyltransferase